MKTIFSVLKKTLGACQQWRYSYCNQQAKLFGIEFKKNKLNIELTGFYKIVWYYSFESRIL
jgi:hypothetical protein